MAMLTDYTDYYDMSANMLLKVHGVDYKREQSTKSLYLKSITMQQSTLFISGQELVQWMRALYSRGLCGYFRVGAIIFCGSVTPFISLNLNKVTESKVGLDCMNALRVVLPNLSEDALIYSEDDAFRILNAFKVSDRATEAELIEAHKFINAIFTRVSGWSVDHKAVVNLLGSPVAKVTLDYQCITGQEHTIVSVNPNLQALGFEQILSQDAASKLYSTHALSHYYELQKSQQIAGL
ncbi:hypothetical protein OTK49_02235 [Vibrio coralliirubri]|uniref:hypothetical protein n=1 Tax=Vibrio coralliirubri TaxID=1516159 RepID=UPI0022845832|nr:hypothetical protein [Vibrio coralliirubri]MCY9861334.1 hypothetical protein [Vibrio coralliirubri]